MKASRSALVLSVALSLAALSTSASAQRATLRIPEANRQAQASVQLLSPGRGERAPVRLQLRQGSTESGRIEIRLRMGMSMGGRSIPPQDNPPIRMTLQTRVTDVACDGSMRYSFECTGVEIVGGDPQLRAALEPALAPLSNMEGWAIIDPRGRTLAADFQLPGATGPTAQMRDQMQSTITQLMPPLPEEPIGVGARWRTEQDVNTDFSFHQTTEFELLSRRGNTVRIRATVQQHADAQDLPAQAVPGQGQVTPHLEGMESAGTATYTQRLDRVLPTSEAQVESTVRMAATSGTPPIELHMVVATEVAPSAN